MPYPMSHHRRWFTRKGKSPDGQTLGKESSLVKKRYLNVLNANLKALNMDKGLKCDKISESCKTINMISRRSETWDKTFNYK